MLQTCCRASIGADACIRAPVRRWVTSAGQVLARERLVDALEAAQYPVSDVQVIEHGDGPVELVAILVSTAVSADELDAVVARLQRQPGVVHANWEVSTRD